MKRINGTIDMIIRNSNITMFKKELDALIDKYSYNKTTHVENIRTSHNIDYSYNGKEAGKVYIINNDIDWRFLVLRVTKDLIKGIMIGDDSITVDDEYSIMYFRNIKNFGYVTMSIYHKLEAEEITMEGIIPLSFDLEGGISNDLLADLVFKYRDRL